MKTSVTIQAPGESAQSEYVVDRDTGVVKWFDIRKGFGFIVDSHGHDVLVHYSAIRDSGFRFLRHRETVEFTTKLGDKGRFAVDVVCLNQTPADTMDR
jgi:CspA family cold shock protein